MGAAIALGVKTATTSGRPKRKEVRDSYISSLRSGKLVYSMVREANVDELPRQSRQVRHEFEMWAGSKRLAWVRFFFSGTRARISECRLMAHIDRSSLRRSCGSGSH